MNERRVARAAAIVTGSVATVTVGLSITWWFDPSFAHYAGSAVAISTFFVAFFGFFLMFGLLVSLLPEWRRTGVFDDSTLWDFRPARLRGWLALVLIAGLLIGAVANLDAAGARSQWEANPPGRFARCEWSLSGDHGARNICVSHARWLSVNLATDRFFVGLGVIFLVVECVIYTTISLSTTRTRTALRDAPSSI